MEKDKNIVEEGIEGVGETAKEAIEGAAEVAGRCRSSRGNCRSSS